MEKKICSNREVHNKWVYFFLLFMMLVFTGIIICKNQMLYSTEKIIQEQIDESVLYSYQNRGDCYSPIDDAAIIYLRGFDIKANELSLIFDFGLDEDTVFTLCNSSSDVEEYIIEQKIVRCGYKNVSFYFEDTHFDEVILLAKSADGSRFVNIPTGEIQLNHRTLNLIQKDKVYFSLLGIIVLIALVFGLYFMTKNKNDDMNGNLRSARDTNLELLRIVCMFLLIAHHYSVHGGLLNLELSLPKYVGLLFLPIGKICFIAFIAISMYFLVDGKSKFQRFLNCWGQVVFYSVSLTVVTWLLGGCVRLRDFVSSFFVMTGNSHGFAASYLLFLLIYPFILKATKDCSKKQARYLLFLLFIIQIVPQILKAWTGYTQPVFSELTLFVFCYVLSLNLKKYPIKLIDKKWFDLLVVVVIYLYAYTLHLMLYKDKLGEVGVFLRQITSDESSIFYIIGGYALFYLFKNIKVRHNKIINSIAVGTFGVLLIHDHNFLRHLFWNEIIRTQTYFNSSNFVVYFFVTLLVIFMACSTIDYIRRNTIEKMLERSNLYKKILRKADLLENKDE